MTQEARRQFAIDVVRRLRDAGFEALWAGGCVRDLLLGRQPGDFDVATNARPEAVRDLFGRRQTLAVGASFGVIIVRGPRAGGQVEVATFRADGDYLDGRRPQSVTFSSAEEDAQRRDFTINGMFYDPLNDLVIDYVDGRTDLDAGVVRAIGDPHLRFTEDKLRLLRAIRFTATMDFALDEITAAAVVEMAPQITVVSAERVTQELRKMLACANRQKAITLADHTGLLAAILPQLPAEPEARGAMLSLLGELRQPAFEVCVTALLTGPDAAEVGRICRALRISNKETDAVVWLTSHTDALDGAAKFEPARLKRLLACPLAPELIELSRARATVSGLSTADADFCTEYLERTPREEIDPPVLLTGDDLVADGFRPGPEFKSILDRVRDAQLNGTVTTSADALEAARQMQAAPED